MIGKGFSGVTFYRTLAMATNTCILDLVRSKISSPQTYQQLNPPVGLRLGENKGILCSPCQPPAMFVSVLSL